MNARSSARHLFHAEVAAREIRHVHLGDALALALLIAEADPKRWPRAAVCWHARFVQEASGIGIDEAGLALAALRAVPGLHGELAAQTLRQLALDYQLGAVASVLERVSR